MTRYSCCVARRCDDAGQSEVVSFASSLCASYGVTTLPTSAGCLPTITTTLVPITTVVGGSTVVSTAMQTVTAYPSGYTPGEMARSCSLPSILNLNLRSRLIPRPDADRNAICPDYCIRDTIQHYREQRQYDNTNYRSIHSGQHGMRS